MDTVAILTRIKASGLTLRASGDRLVVGSTNPLTEHQRQFIREHKASILKALATPPTPPYSHPCYRASSARSGGHSSIVDLYRDP